MDQLEAGYDDGLAFVDLKSDGQRFHECTALTVHRFGDDVFNADGAPDTDESKVYWGGCMNAALDSSRRLTEDDLDLLLDEGP